MSWTSSGLPALVDSMLGLCWELGLIISPPEIACGREEYSFGQGAFHETRDIPCEAGTRKRRKHWCSLRCVDMHCSCIRHVFLRRGHSCWVRQCLAYCWVLHMVSQPEPYLQRLLSASSLSRSSCFWSRVLVSPLLKSGGSAWPAWNMSATCANSWMWAQTGD